ISKKLEKMTSKLTYFTKAAKKELKVKYDATGAEVSFLNNYDPKAIRSSSEYKKWSEQVKIDFNASKEKFYSNEVKQTLTGMQSKTLINSAADALAMDENHPLFDASSVLRGFQEYLREQIVEGALKPEELAQIKEEVEAKDKEIKAQKAQAETEILDGI